MVFQVLLLLLLLVCSAFFSGSESALFSLSRYELSRMRASSHTRARLAAQLMEHPRSLLLTLMIGNVTVNMFIFALSLNLFSGLFEAGSLWGPALGLITPLAVTLVGDILPKGLAIVGRRKLAPRLAPLIQGVKLVLAPLNAVLGWTLVGPLTRLLTGARRPDEYVTREELAELIEISEQHRIIDADENAMLGEVLRLGELHVYDVMVPRMDMVAFDIHDRPSHLREILREHRFTKIPAYDATIDRILGVVYARDVFLNPAREPATLVRPVRFVPEIITLAQLLAHFRSTGSQLAVAVNEYGALTGLVTIEDVASQIVGDLAPPMPDEQPLWERIDERHYRVSGRISIHDWAEQFQFRKTEESVTTLAGLLLSRLGRVPQVGDQVRIGNLNLTVESLTGRRIEWIGLELLDDPQGTASPPRIHAPPPAEGRP